MTKIINMNKVLFLLFLFISAHCQLKIQINKAIEEVLKVLTTIVKNLMTNRKISVI